MKSFKTQIFAISIILIFIVILIFIFILTSCIAFDGETEDGAGKLKIVATLFPQYDFAKQIAGDKANVKLLLPPGVESHSFDPKPGDIVKIYNADLFIYTGENMEPWAETVLKGAANENLIIVDCSKNIELFLEQDDDDHGHEHHADPHIWLDPVRAVQMVENILGALCEKDPENAGYYRQNADDYIKLLQKFDGDMFDLVNHAKRKVIVFGGRFSYIYFLTHFGLDYVTAYDSCASTEEPSVSKVLSVVKFINENNIPCIYHEELSAHQIAKAIAKEAGRKTYLFSTAHNVTKSEFDGGITFLDIMYANLENLKIGLN